MKDWIFEEDYSGSGELQKNFQLIKNQNCKFKVQNTLIQDGYIRWVIRHRKDSFRVLYEASPQIAGELKHGKPR